MTAPVPDVAAGIDNPYWNAVAADARPARCLSFYPEALTKKLP